MVPMLSRLSPDAIPRIEFDLVVEARNKTVDEISSSIASTVGSASNDLGEIMSAASLAERPFLVVVDSLDEVVDPRALLQKLIFPLVQAADRVGVRFLVGTRRYFATNLTKYMDALVIDLDETRFAEPEALMDYIRAALIGFDPNSPYREAPTAVVNSVAQSIASAAGNSFLVARILASHFAARREIPDVNDSAWRNALPTTASDALHVDLDSRLGSDSDRARSLLLPLAFAQGNGLPWEDIWPRLAEALSGETCTNEDLIWLFNRAGSYIIESVADGRSSYRLFHEALAEALRVNVDVKDANAKIVRALVRSVPADRNGRIEWVTAHPYILRHLAAHAVAAEMIDDLILDSSFLVAADPSRLKAAFPAVKSDAGRAAVREYERRHDPHKIVYPGSSDRPSARDYLHRQTIVQVLAELLSSTAPSVTGKGQDFEGPTVITIEGPWGAGKTTILGLLRAALKQRSASRGPVSNGQDHVQFDVLLEQMCCGGFGGVRQPNCRRRV